MVDLDLSKRDVLILIETLEVDVSDLRMEIADTDRLEYREMLKEKKEALKRALEGLRRHV